MSASEKGMKRIVARLFRRIAQLYVRIHHPLVIAVGGSVGKTSTKLALATLLTTEKNVSCMDDSYNSGLGLYLSVFRLKVPRRSTPFAWARLLAMALWRTLSTSPEILILEYGIDNSGDMDDMVKFIRPDISVLTAVTPEHMEFLKTIDTVGHEEAKILSAAKQYALVSSVDVDAKYYQSLNAPLVPYGSRHDDARYDIVEWKKNGAIVDFVIEDTALRAHLKIISEPTIRQISGLLWLALKVGITHEALEKTLPTIEAAASRLSLLRGVNDSIVIDDSANFSPDAGVVALQTLKRLPAERRIAVLGNMHELGEFADAGYADVAAEFDKLDMIVLIGDLSQVRFKKLAEARGYIMDKNLFIKNTSIEAGEWLRDSVLKAGDAVLVKGPFGGWYMEEAVKAMLADPKDGHKLTRQSEFWDNKKSAHFGDSYQSAP